MELDRDDVIDLIKSLGFKVVHMTDVREYVNGVEMTAYTRRIYERSFLIRELEWLRKNHVRTIGLYSVTPLERKVEGATLPVSQDGIKLRWAYKQGI